MPKVGQEIGRVWLGYCRDRLLNKFRGSVLSILEKLRILGLGGAICTLVSKQRKIFKRRRVKARGCRD